MPVVGPGRSVRRPFPEAGTAASPALPAPGRIRGLRGPRGTSRPSRRGRLTAVHMDPMLPRLVAALFLVLALAVGLRRARTPMLVVYLLAGVCLGPEGFGVLEDRVLLGRVGEFGVLFLLFFVGMEMSLPRLLKGWKVALGGTALQVLGSVAAVLAVGNALGWPVGRSVLLGFVISLSSTAVVLRLLQDRKELDTPVGQDVLGILLAQDLAMVPMLMVISVLSGERPHVGQLITQGAVALAAIWVLLSVSREPGRLRRVIDGVAADPELRLFGALLFCLGTALVTAWAGLSTALGAFLAGLALSVAGRTDWAHRALDSLRVLLLATFFAAVGSLVDLSFLRENLFEVGLLTLLALSTNTLVNTAILRGLGRSWARALRGGAYLSQIGELSFVLAAVGLSSGLIQGYGHRMTVAVIACTLVLSTVWIGAAGMLERRLAPRWTAGD